MYNIFRILIGVPDYSSSSLFLNEEEAIPPPPDKQNTPGILYIPPPRKIRTHLDLLSIPRFGGRQNKRLGGTIGYYYDKVGL